MNLRPGHQFAITCHHILIAMIDIRCRAHILIIQLVVRTRFVVTDGKCCDVIDDGTPHKKDGLGTPDDDAKPLIIKV